MKLAGVADGVNGEWGAELALACKYYEGLKVREEMKEWVAVINLGH